MFQTRGCVHSFEDLVDRIQVRRGISHVSTVTDCLCREKMKIPANVIDQLIEGAQSDIRQVLNMLSTWKLQNSTMDFDEGKAL